MGFSYRTIQRTPEQAATSTARILSRPIAQHYVGCVPLVGQDMLVSLTRHQPVNPVDMERASPRRVGEKKRVMALDDALRSKEVKTHTAACLEGMPEPWVSVYALQERAYRGSNRFDQSKK